jgi:uncharacterized protein (DUF885 family)
VSRLPSTQKDGKPGKYLINAYKADEQSRAGLESTTFHETYPGHQLQGAIALERTKLHPIQKYFWLSGFGEGWVLYSERLADELGLFSGDLDRLGLLSNEALRAVRLVVDSGLHALGWTRDQAVEYLLANRGVHSQQTYKISPKRIVGISCLMLRVPNVRYSCNF